MSETVCKNCGKPEGSHPWMHGSRLCIATYFKPKPEPIKAKPGVRYRYMGTVGTRSDRIGSASGMLAFTVNNSTNVSYIPLSPDWTEVPE